MAKKLGLTSATVMVVFGEPEGYNDLLGPLPPGFQRHAAITKAVTLVHVFVIEREVLASHLNSLRNTLDPGAAIWVSWPKKASKVPTTITEDTIREIALPPALRKVSARIL